MRSAKTNIFIVMFTLLVLVGQVMAAAINSCQNDQIANENGAQLVQMAGHSTHSTRHNSDVSTIEKNSESCICCDLDCYCPMGSCVSVVVSALHNQSEFAYLSNKIERLPQSAISQIIPSLFRPPIS